MCVVYCVNKNLFFVVVVVVVVVFPTSCICMRTFEKNTWAYVELPFFGAVVCERIFDLEKLVFTCFVSIVFVKEHLWCETNFNWLLNFFHLLIEGAHDHVLGKIRTHLAKPNVCVARLLCVLYIDRVHTCAWLGIIHTYIWQQHIHM